MDSLHEEYTWKNNMPPCFDGEQLPKVIMDIQLCFKFLLMSQGDSWNPPDGDLALVLFYFSILPWSLRLGECLPTFNSNFQIFF
jgi:hypothetical protein